MISTTLTTGPENPDLTGVFKKRFVSLPANHPLGETDYRRPRGPGSPPPGPPGDPPFFLLF